MLLTSHKIYVYYKDKQNIKYLNMKKVLKFLIQSIIIIVISFSAFYILYYICLALFGIDIIHHRHMHHFIAGTYWPYLYISIFGYKTNKKNIKKSAKTGCYVYIIFCIGWETFQAISRSRGIQFDRYCLIFVG